MSPTAPSAGSRRRRRRRPSSRASRGTPSGPRDVFPEEFETFVLGDPHVRDAFRATTPTCSRRDSGATPSARIAEGEVVDFFPYPEDVRFRRGYADPSSRGKPR